MDPEQLEKYKKIFLKNHGILRASRAIRLGIPEHMIYSMIQNGDLVREARGLYRLAGGEPPGNPDLVQVSLLAPKSVIFLVSALYFHRLTTQIPHQVHIALPRGAQRPAMEYPPLKVYFRSLRQYQAGIEEHTLDGIRVRIYDREKTVADCFMYQKQAGKDTAIEALKDYLRQPAPNPGKLIEYARLDRVEKSMRPYLEALL